MYRHQVSLTIFDPRGAEQAKMQKYFLRLLFCQFTVGAKLLISSYGVESNGRSSAISSYILTSRDVSPAVLVEPFLMDAGLVGQNEAHPALQVFNPGLHVLIGDGNANRG